MPILNHFAFLQTPAGPAIGGQTLSQQGAITPVEVTIPQTLETLLKTAGETPPSPCNGIALIDTGAARSYIDASVARQLKLLPISAVQVISANGVSLQGTYVTRIKFPAIGWDVDFSSVLSFNFSEQTVQDMPVIVIIGRDLLANCIFIYNGTAGTFVLAH